MRGYMKSTSLRISYALLIVFIISQIVGIRREQTYSRLDRKSVAMGTLTSLDGGHRVIHANDTDGVSRVVAMVHVNQIDKDLTYWRSVSQNLGALPVRILLYCDSISCNDNHHILAQTSIPLSNYAEVTAMNTMVDLDNEGEFGFMTPHRQFVTRTAKWRTRKSTPIATALAISQLVAKSS
jgi:hypothetical protein